MFVECKCPVSIEGLKFKKGEKYYMICDLNIIYHHKKNKYIFCEDKYIEQYFDISTGCENFEDLLSFFAEKSLGKDSTKRERDSFIITTISMLYMEMKENQEKIQLLLNKIESMNKSIEKLTNDIDEREESYKINETVTYTKRVEINSFIKEKIEFSEDSFMFTEDMYEEYKSYSLKENGLEPIPYITFCKYLNEYDFDSDLVSKGTRTKDGRHLTCYYGIRIK